MRLSERRVFQTIRIEKEMLTAIELLEHAGYVKKVGNGQYIYLNMAQRVINNINRIISNSIIIIKY